MVGNCFAGNFLFSFRPDITVDMGSSERSVSVSWSDDFKGGKAVRLTGIFDKLSYKVRKAFSVEYVKCSFSTAHCSLKAEGEHIGNIHFLIQIIGRDVPVMLPEKSGDASESKDSPVALQEQKEIFLLPTVRVSNLLQSEIHVFLSETGNNRKLSDLISFCNVVMISILRFMWMWVQINVPVLALTILETRQPFSVVQQLIFMLILP